MSKEEFYSYFIKNNIRILETKFQIEDKIQYKDIVNQIDLITLFHKELKGYKENLIPRIGSTIGKDFENYKLQIRKLSMDIESISKKDNLTQLDLFILDKGPMIIKKGKNSINSILNSDYEGLIRRSMISYEVCLGKVDESNLKLSEDGYLKVGTVDYLTYNLIEHDFYNYIKKIRRKVSINNMDKLIERYLNSLDLDSRSLEYLKALFNFPDESLKVWVRFKSGKKYVGCKECLEALKVAMTIDGII